MRDPVKGKTEAGRDRELRALATRQRILDAAIALFLERGYAATTIELIARHAGVAPATVYQAFGSKPQVLTRALDVTVAGDAKPVPLLEQDWVTEAQAEPDASRRLTLVVMHTSQVAARTAPIKEVLRDAAATEPELTALVVQDHERRYRTQQTLVQIIAANGALRDDMTLDQAAATFFALVNSHSCQLLAQQLKWTVTDWQRWLLALLHRELLGTEILEWPEILTVREQRKRPARA